MNDPLRGAALTARLLAPIVQPPAILTPLLWAALCGTAVFVTAALYAVLTGIGVFSNDIPAAWAWPITNFVWWIGIGHAGTFISAILLLLAQSWRAPITRISEAMTIFALVNAALFPILHLGRPWFVYWLVPYPATMEVWPQFRSALTWDAGAVATYFLLSLMIFFLSLVPDLAAARDATTGLWRRRWYGLFALGWSGTTRQWRVQRSVQTLLCGLVTPLVVSVHSIVSLDFAITSLPGWHTTLFPPYFVAGALFSGFAMLTLLLIPIRWLYGLQDVIHDGVLDRVGKLFLATGLVVDYSYLVELYLAWRSDDPAVRQLHLELLPFGPMAPVFWATMFCNVLAPQLLWWGRARRSPLASFAVGVLVLAGMWLERFTIIVGSLIRDRLPSSWAGCTPTLVDVALLLGSISLFTLLFLLFLRFVPFVPIAELKEARRG